MHIQMEVVETKAKSSDMNHIFSILVLKELMVSASLISCGRIFDKIAPL